MAPISLYDQALADFTSAVRQTRIKEGDADGERQLSEFLKARGSPQDAQESARSLQQDAGRKYVGNIQNAIAVGNRLMAGAPETVSAAWFVVKLGLGAIQNNYALYSLFGSGLTAMTEIMILIPHYDTMFDKRDKAGYKVDNLTQMLFRDIVACYVAVLDFLFSIKRHIEASAIGKFRHALKDVVGTQGKKFQAKQDTIMALKAKVLVDSEAAFQGKMFDQMGDVQESLKSTLSDISSFNATAKELAQSQSDILDSLADLKASLKPKSRWDWSRQEFENHVKTLEPYQSPVDVVSVLLQRKRPDTCEWIFENNKYTAWVASERGQLCLTGDEGVGKSIVTSVLTEKLANDLDNVKVTMCYLSCATPDGAIADLGEDPAGKIRATLIHHIYKELAEDEYSDRPELLEDANKLFHQPKKNEKQKGIAGPSTDRHIPPVPEAIPKLLRLVRKGLTLVVDGLDRLTKNDQLSLYKDFSTLVTDCEVNIKVLAVCRSNQPFSSQAITSEGHISVGANNSTDIGEVLNGALQQISGLTAQERQEAKDKVVERAGGSFAYISDLAIPFLEQPFQRPLSNRLKMLPEGITDTYKQALQSMNPAYYDLLQTALMWTIYAKDPVRIQEIMEAHSGIYLADVDVDDTNYQENRATNLEIAQLDEASGPFLRTYKNSWGVWLCAPKDPAQIRKFCSSPGHEEHTGEEGVLCSRCHAEMSSNSKLVLPEKMVHLKLTLTMLRHLNNKLFQKRFNLMPRSVARSDTADTQSSAGADDAEVPAEAQASAQRDDTSLAAEASASADPDDVSSAKQADSLIVEEKVAQIDALLADDQAATAAAAAAAAAQAGETPEAKNTDNNESGYITDQSEDYEYDEDPTPAAPAEDLVEAGDGAVWRMRYEIDNWPHHMLMAEQLWADDDKSVVPEWQELIAELDKFVFDTPDVFMEWQMILTISRMDYPNTEDYFQGDTALHVAARLGLKYWVEHLLANKEQDINLIRSGYAPVQAVQPDEDNRELLKFFLQHPKLDKAAVSGPGSDDYKFPVINTWLQKNGTVETVKLLLEYGADFVFADPVSRMAPLHFLSMSITEPEALRLVLAAPGEKKVDINVQREGKWEPLHYLLYRTDISVEIVEAYLENGADIDAEADNSLRPLEAACENARPDIVVALLKRGVADINDPDDTGRTALHSACGEGGDLACARLLLEYGADLEILTTRGRSALACAAWDGKLDIVKGLLELGANPLSKDTHYRTPLFFACLYNSDPDIATALLAALKEKHTIQEINAPTKRGRTPLRMAATRGFTAIIKELIDMTAEAGLDVAEMLNMQDEVKKATALHCAAKLGQVETVRVLLEHGANATLRDKDDRTPLQLASVQWQSLGTTRYEEVIYLLVPHDVERAKADPDLPATSTMQGSVKVLQQLAAHGIDVNKPDSYGWPSVLLAQRMRLTEVEKFLRSSAAWRDKLPTAWIKHQAVPSSMTLSEDGLTVTNKCQGRGTATSLTTNRPLPSNLDRFYYEVTFTAPEGDHKWTENPVVGIGFSNLSGVAYDVPGWEAKRGVRNGHSFAYHGDDGWYGNSVRNPGVYGEPFGLGDTAGAGVDLTTQTIWFTKNGKRAEFEHENIQGRLFPIIGFDQDAVVETNFGGKPFKWQEGGESAIAEDDKTTGEVLVAEFKQT
ncbi:hypothetical protein AMS68_004141 [Peltaster fructicola]|uniref:protein S-acyltransferase n=1 Tax=Peltaster fructicola TaxID=286661 RepID=A0A6H0XV62_9PEZI|nr:hypothetical protein AMS68_004141 [Peltaster fructicola]